MAELEGNKMKHPIQPIETDITGVLRFKANPIVRHVLDWAQEHGHGLNELSRMDFSADDWQQFAQLIGYSLSGYSSLSYVDDAAYEAAEAIADNPEVHSMQARLDVSESKLKAVKDGLREPMAALFEVHPDDLR